MVRCLIIDDEKNARENLENLVGKYCPELTVSGLAHSGMNGIQRIREEKPDAIFLDVHMSDIDGFTLLSRLEEPKPMVVFVTAYEKYALRAIKASAIDYIKLMIQSSHDENPERIALPDHSGYRFEHMRDIIRMESDSNYTTIFLKGGEKVVVSKPMKHFEDFLDDAVFIRIHNSHIVNIHFLKGYLRDDGGIAELIDGTKLQIAKRRLPLFLDTIKNRFIKP
ncbi:MAG: response regulator transcription factor [Flavobacteriales bacterium]|nr:response regulator transcription factor [Flavobacteriales bacterium]